MTLNDLLDEAKAITGSDYKTAALMNLKGQHVSNWRKGRCKPNSASRAMLANITKRDLNELNALIEIDGETDKEKIKHWKRLGGIAATILLTTAAAPPIQIFPTLYIM